MKLRCAVAFFFLLLLALPVPARAWDEIQSIVAKDAAECVSWAPDRIDCLTRTVSGSLTWTYRANGQWSVPRDLGGKLAAAPSCIVRGPGGINCFATSAKGVLATINLNGRKWSDWSSLGGNLKPSRASCVALGRDRIACFARSRTDTLAMRKWSGGKTWEPWRDLGGALSEDPECILVGGGNAACFGRGAAGELVAFLPEAAGRSGGWTTLGGRIEGKPSCVRLNSGEAACAAQSRSGRLHIWRGMPVFADTPGVTASIEEAVVGEPACAQIGGEFVCFARNLRRQLVRRSVGADEDGSRDGVLDAPPVAAVNCLSLADDVACLLTDGDRKLHFALGADLVPAASGQPVAITPAIEVGPPDGTWFLTNVQTGRTCRVILAGEALFGTKRLRAGPVCRVVGLPARPTHWDKERGELLFLATDGRIVLRFRPTQAGRWISPRRDQAFLLSREPVDANVTAELTANPPPPSGREPSEMFGPWRVVDDRAGPLCTLQLTNQRHDDGYAIRWEPGCEDRLAPVRYWTESGPALVLIGHNNVVVARFEAAGPGAWRSQALGGLTLER